MRVIKVDLHEGAGVSRAISQLGSSALVVPKYMPRNITPPLILAVKVLVVAHAGDVGDGDIAFSWLRKPGPPERTG